MRIGVVSVWIVLLTASLVLIPNIWDVPAWVELTFFIFLMITLGIPHGAVDHLVYFSQIFSQNTTENPIKHKKTLWAGFLKFYFGIMLLYGLMWWLVPVLSFALFLVFSAYHFGQSQLYYLGVSKNFFLNNFLKKALYLSWGVFILTALLYFNQAQTLQILQNTPFVKLISSFFEYAVLVQVISVIGFFGILCFLLVNQQITVVQIIQETCLGILLYLLFAHTTLLWSFAVYFALWHSLQTIEQEITVFRTSKQFETYNWKNYLVDTLPFSVVSVVAIIIICAFLYHFEFDKNYLLFAFFVFISILTAPHAFLMEKIYK